MHIYIHICIHILSIHLTVIYVYIYNTSLGKQKVDRRPPKKGGLLDTAASNTLMHAGCCMYKTLLKQMRLRQAKVLQKKTPSCSCQT